jgi:hypothetical protein
MFDASHDDGRQMGQAISIVKGDWLGGYDNLTLAKGSFFPLLMAFCYFVGIPLLISMPVLYSLASLSFIKAIQPAVKRRWPLVAAYVLLLFNPAQYSSSVLRVYRDGWNNCILLLLLSGVIGLTCRKDRASLRGLLPWSVMSGIAGAAFWDTREEAIWILPVILGLSLLIMFSIFRGQRKHRLSRLFVLLVLPIFLWFLCVQAVCFVNWWNYGIWTLIETRSKNYSEALSLLVKAKTGEWRQYIACPRDTREKIYTASPVFAELRPFLESGRITAWKNISEGLIGVKDEYGTHFIWALRDAVAAAGYYKNAVSADAFYARLASELKGAYQKGIIEKEPGSVLGGLGQPFNLRHARLLSRSLVKGMNMILKLDGWNAPTMTSSIISGEGVYFNRDTRQLGNINIMPPSDVIIEGWSFISGEGSGEIVLERKDGKWINWSGFRVERDDVKEWLLTQGYDYPGSSNLGFVIEAAKLGKLENLYIRIKGRDGQEGLYDAAGQRWVEEPKLPILFKIDKVMDEDQVSLREILDKMRKTQLIRIATLYAYATKWLVFASLIVVTSVFIQRIRRKLFSCLVLPYICVMLYGVPILRLVLLALLEATTFPNSINDMYMSPAWVGLYGAIAVCIAFSCDMLPIEINGKTKINFKLHFKGGKTDRIH